MNNNFKVIKEGNGERILARNFEEIIETAEVIIFNENHIEIPGIVIFSKENKGFFFQLLNPGVEIFSVNEEDYEKMINLLTIEEDHIVSFETKTLPTSTARLNLSRIKDNLLLVRESDSLLVLNKILLTTNEFEFHGSGMFSGRENVFLVSEEDFSKIREYIL